MSRWRTLLAIDHDPKAVEVYRANIPANRVECGEVKDFDLRLGADVILGGPPCQPFSHAGDRKGDKDARDCVPDFIAAVASGQPRQFLMEQVPGFGTFDDGRYMQRTVSALIAAGYAVEGRKLDAVNFGVPQFRERWWFWGIRNDLPGARAIGRPWPRPTHTWPWSKQACMFGGDLLPAVVVGQALELDGWIKRPRQTGAREIVGTDEPMQSLSSTRTDENYFIRRARAASVERRDHPASEPSPTLADGSGGSGGILRIIGGGSNPRVPGGIRTERDITAEPCTTLSVDAGNALPLAVADTIAAPCPTICNGSKRTGGPEPIPHRVREGFIRRLTPDECARLQSLPDDFIWPASVAKTHRYRVIGNGWASLMAKRMGEALAAADPESHTLIDLFCGGGCGAVGWHGRAWEYTA